MNNASAKHPPKPPNNVGRGTTSRRNNSPRPRTSIAWDEADNQLLRDTVVAVTGAGAAIQFARTTDGGALVVKVFDGDGDPIKEYPHSVDDLETTLRWLVAMFTDD